MAAYLIIFIALAFVPLVGSIALMLLAPVVAGGLVHACRLLEEGRQARLPDFFAGFGDRFSTLAKVGLIYLGATLAIMLPVTAVAPWPAMTGGDAAAIATAQPEVLIAVLVMAGLMLPLFMALWFAPPLVMFHDLRAGESMKMSLRACLRNIVPFLVYGVLMLVLSVVASILIVVGWLILSAVISGSLYAAYRDIFFE